MKSIPVVWIFFLFQIYPHTQFWLPHGSFLTGGVDETIRVWNIDHEFDKVFRSFSNITDWWTSNSFQILTSLFAYSLWKRRFQATQAPFSCTNIYSEELKKIVYVVKNDAHLIESSDGNHITFTPTSVFVANLTNFVNWHLRSSNGIDRPENIFAWISHFTGLRHFPSNFEFFFWHEDFNRACIWRVIWQLSLLFHSDFCT